MKKVLSLLALLIGSVAFGQSVTLPATINVANPGLVVIKPSAFDGDSISYTAVDSGLQFIPSELLKDSTTAVGLAMQPGTYRFRAIAAKVVGGKAALSPFVECSIVVAGTPPPPPTPPAPNDPLFPTLQTAFFQEADKANRLAQVQQLAAFFRVGVQSANDPTVLTVGSFFTTWDKAVRSVLGDPTSTLPFVRAALGKELNTKLPTAPAQPMDATTRKQIADAFTRMASLLDALTPAR